MCTPVPPGRVSVSCGAPGGTGTLARSCAGATCTPSAMLASDEGARVAVRFCADAVLCPGTLPKVVNRQPITPTVPAAMVCLIVIVALLLRFHAGALFLSHEVYPALYRRQ